MSPSDPTAHPAPARRSTRPGRPSLALVVAGAWTLFVWVSRVRNIVRDDSLVGGERTAALSTAIGFSLLGVCLLWAAAVRRRDPRWGTISLRVIAAVTMVYWPIRALAIVLGDHPVGFVVVHTILAAVSVALGAWVLVDVRDSSTGSDVVGGRTESGPTIIRRGSSDGFGHHARGDREGAR